jgi:hypothetical protein
MDTDGFTTCLWFDGRAEEAARFYVSLFENSSLGAVTRYPEGAHQPAGTVLTVDFTANGQRFVALNGGPEFRFNEAISFQITCDDQKRLAQGPVRRLLAGRPGPARGDVPGPRSHEGGAGQPGHDDDAQARHRRAGEGVRRGVKPHAT